MSVDPLAEAQVEFTPYHYCYNNPINHNDPTGMLGESSNDDNDHLNLISPIDQDLINNNKDGNSKKNSDRIDPCGNRYDDNTDNLNDFKNIKLPNYIAGGDDKKGKGKGSKKSNSKGKAIVYIETDGIGHAYILINGTVFSYGRYNGSYSPSMGKLGPIGPGVLLKLTGHEATNFIQHRMAESPTEVYTVSINTTDAYNYLNNLYNSGTPSSNGSGRIIDTYILLITDCSSTVGNALEKGGLHLFSTGSPAALGASIKAEQNLENTLNSLK